MPQVDLFVLLFYCCLSFSSFGHGDEGVGWAYDYIATKSSYFSRPKTAAHEAITWNVENVVEGYEPFHVDALYRHGTRYPQKEKLTIWKRRLVRLRKLDINNKIFETLKLWDKYFPPSYSYALHRKGWFEMGVLADRLFEKTRNIFNHIFSDRKLNTGSVFITYSSPKARVLASANAFLTRLKCLSETSNEKEKRFCSRFQEDKVLLNSQPEEGDTVLYGGFVVLVEEKTLRAFDNCKRYIHSVERNSSAESEFQEFFKTRVFQKVKSDISHNFNSTLEEADIVSLYKVCSFAVALHDKSSVCSLFTKQHLQVMEFASDLRHFYKTGYGHEINYRLSCNLLNEIVLKLDEAKNAPNNARHSAVLRFGHAETLIPLLCLLGLFKDPVPLTSTSYDLHKDNRLFRTGTFSPFAGNIAFVLYKATFQTNNPLKLAVVLNDLMIKLPVGGGCHLCNYDVARDWLVLPLTTFNCESVCLHHAVHEEF